MACSDWRGLGEDPAGSHQVFFVGPSQVNRSSREKLVCASSGPFFAGDAGTQPHSPVCGLQGKPTSSAPGATSGNKWRWAIVSSLHQPCVRACESSGTKLLWFPWKNVNTNLGATWNLYKAAAQWHQPAGSHYFFVTWLLILEKNGCLHLCWVGIQWETPLHTTTNLNLQLVLGSLNNFSPRHAAKENTTKIILSETD